MRKEDWKVCIESILNEVVNEAGIVNAEMAQVIELITDEEKRRLGEMIDEIEWRDVTVYSKLP